MAQTESRVSWRKWTLPEPAVFTCAPAPERLHNRAVGSLAETTHLGRLGGIGGSSLRPAPHTAPCSRTPCATPRMTTIYVHIPLSSDRKRMHAHRGPPFVSANTGTADFVQNVTAPNSRGISRVCVIWEATSTIAVCSLAGGVRPR